MTRKNRINPSRWLKDQQAAIDNRNAALRRHATGCYVISFLCSKLLVARLKNLEETGLYGNKGICGVAEDLMLQKLRELERVEENESRPATRGRKNRVPVLRAPRYRYSRAEER